jgi:DUF1680 family protein
MVIVSGFMHRRGTTPRGEQSDHRERQRTSHHYRFHGISFLREQHYVDAHVIKQN